MSKKIKLLAIISLIVFCFAMFGACELKYGEPDSLNIAQQSIGQRIWIGLQVAFLGIVTVFVVLLVLIGFVILLKYLMVLLNKMSQLKLKKPAKQEPVQIVIEDTVKDEIAENEDEVVAAITAALMAYYDAEQKIKYESNVSFVVRSIKKINR